MSYYEKYLKYKIKYNHLKKNYLLNKQIGGNNNLCDELSYDTLFVLSTNNLSTNYKTIFDKVQEANGKVQQLMNSKVSGANPSGQDIVVDMTNMNAGSRKSAMKAIEGNEDKYHKVAVDFRFKGAEDVIKKMAEKRAEAAQRMGKSKTIPPAAFDRMFSSYEEPTTAEGFDEVISVDNIENLKRALNDDGENINETIINIIRESVNK